jgi:hypothetical protein
MHKIAGEANRFKAGLIPQKKRARPATSTSSIRVPVEGRGLEFLWHNRAPNSGRDRERTRVQLGASVNSLHAFARSDDLGGTAGDFLETALDRGSLTRQRRLLIRMTMSSANQCRSYMALLRCQLAGLAVPAKIAAAISSPNSVDLSAHEWSAIRFVLATQPELRDVGLIQVGSLHR